MKQLLSDAANNLRFLGVCVLVAAVLILLAWAAQRALGKSRPGLRPARRVSYTAIFSAVAALLMLVDIPLFFAPSFYQLDLSEIPVLICTFYLGPVSGVVCELLKNLLKLLLKGTTTAFVGDFANFAVGCSFVLPASILYQRWKSRKGAVLALVIGSLVLTVFGSLFNAWFLLPRFAQLYGMPLEAIVAAGTQINSAITSVWTLVLFAVVPFNLLKGAVVSMLTMVLYKRVEKLLLHD